ncbi:LysR family transcriptional regulator [Gluconobacter wancherniae]|uniref:LysR family transcriptional regulator n=1 Tax=Gluconobacter wancherniae TaxID=1307955 RepID=UPI001B8C6BD6|nr:LysR family transcriptional regulator [Gluconobacter wancherniae]MBS1061539.1 LysR family transcriptional regulator [Gluconobacter wancherniae]MBS1088003.1 LysR family transcriptional regulator [Gluconobacter wancherniae]MBS1093695.1 LysR family transcriptional regulator [Gluconobacter wancherniae]
MLDRITGMQVFVRVAALGSFSAAGRDLSLSQTMITKHIVALETRMGSTLFHRSTRKLSLTESGRLFLDGCQKILADISEVEHTVGRQKLEPQGKLRLNAPVSFAIRHLGPLMPEFSRRYPFVTVELGLNDRSVDLIEEGWDLTLRIRQMASSTLRTRKLADVRFAICASPAYLERAGTPKRIAELSEHTCLGYTLSPNVGPSRWSFGPNGEKSISVKCALTANNGDVLREAAVAGQGIIYQPSFIVNEELHDGRLKRLELDYPTIEGPSLHAVYPPSDHVPLKVRAMIDYLVECYGPVPPWDRVPS